MWQHVNVVRLGAPALLTLLIATGGNSTRAAQIALCGQGAGSQDAAVVYLRLRSAQHDGRGVRSGIT